MSMTKPTSEQVTFLQAGTGAVTTTVQTKLRQTVSVFDFMTAAQIADVQAGTASIDVTTAIQAAIDGVSNGTTILFPRGTYKVTSQLLISGKTQLILLGDRGARIRFDDGAYIGLLFTGGSGSCMVNNLSIDGTNNTTPTITLLKATGNSAGLTVQNCTFRFASIGVLLAQSYIMRMQNNVYSGCDTAFKATTAEGSVVDLALIGEVFGTCLIGSNPVVDIQYADVRFVGCFWETQTNTKKSLNITSPTQRAIVSGCQFTASGELHIQTSNFVSVSGCNFKDSYSNNRTIRIDGGAVAQITGNTLTLSSLSASVVGVAASGIASTVGNYFSNYLTGASQGSGTISANTFSNCTTGAIATGSTVLSNDNLFSGCTTNVTTNGTATAIAPSFFTGTLTGCTTSPTALMRYEVNNGFVVLTLPNLSATSNTTACTITGLPAAIQPTNDQFASAALVLDNGTQSAEQCRIDGGANTITLFKDGSITGFTNSGTKGTRACTIVYRLRNVS